MSRVTMSLCPASLRHYVPRHYVINLAPFGSKIHTDARQRNIAGHPSCGTTFWDYFLELLSTVRVACVVIARVTNVEADVIIIALKDIKYYIEQVSFL